jgi:hypothetical protein
MGVVPVWRVGAALLRGRVVLSLALALTLAACGGPLGQPSPSDADRADYAEYLAASRGGLIKFDQVHGWAFGRIWRRQTHDKRELRRGIDAYKGAITACQGVIDGQSPEAMVRALRKDPGFSQQGAQVIVAAALRTICPDHRPVGWFTDAAQGPLTGDLPSVERDRGR